MEVVALVGAAVGTAVGTAVVNSVVAKLTDVVTSRSRELGNQLAGDIDSLKTDLNMISSMVEALENGRPNGLHLEGMARMRDLSFDIEDCLDKFIPCAACQGGAVPIVRVEEFARRVGDLKERLKNAQRQIKAYHDQQSAAAGGTEAGASVPRSVASTTLSDAEKVVIEKPKQEILGLLESENLAVISIVGFGGSGKTQLAWEVYSCRQVKENFGLRVWAVASEYKDGDGLLLAILKELVPEEALTVPPDGNQVESFREKITFAQQQERCLIVIDDIEMHHWEPIRRFFSELTIKILLTTTVESAANRCTAGRGYIYNMRSLSEEESKYLLRIREPRLGGPSPDLALGSDAIVHKCHGHPLALTSVANYLLTKQNLTGDDCKDTGRLICSHTDENTHGIFTELRHLLVNNYTCLPGDVKTCLLYASLFPSDRPVSRKTLTSRLLAEGYIGAKGQRSAQEVADKNLGELMDRNIIRPMDTSNSGKAKMLKPQGIMHQFMLYKSISSNFIATSRKDRGNSRHLVIENHRNTGAAAHHRNALTKLFPCFHPSTSRGCDEELRPRSVTVIGSAEESVYSDLLKCKLLRVLDLSECNDSLRKRHRNYIYKLLHLKYLTLGKSVSKIDDEMKNLHCLETLDLTKGKIFTLPVEVISLPHLAHLFGKIRIKRVGFMTPKKICLQTLAGVVVDNKSGFPELMGHMEQLTKVKIWCKITSTVSKNYTMLSNAIHQYSRGRLDTPENSRSLSLHLNDSSKDLLRGDDGLHGALRVMKLLGRASQFGGFVKSLTGIKELCLTSIDLKDADLPALHALKLLVCLKLVQDSLEGLHINPQDFKSLQRLCLVVEEPRFPTIAGEAWPSLTSIQLLCGGLERLAGIEIQYLTSLCEVSLDCEVRQETITAWEREANAHPKRPKIVFLERVNPTDSRSVVKYVAPDQTSSGPHQVQGTP